MIQSTLNNSQVGSDSLNFEDTYIPGDSADWGSAKRILVFQCKQLGDALLLTPVIRWLYEKHPHITIDVLCKPISSQIFDSLPNVGSVFELQPTVLNLVNLLKNHLPRDSYDMFLDFHGSRESVLLSILLNARVRFTVGEFKTSLAGKVWTHKLPKSPSKRHTVERNFDVLRRLGVVCDEFVPLSITFMERAAKDKLQIDPDSSYIVVHPVANWMFKTPSVKFWVGLLNQLADTFDGKIVLTGGSAPLEVQFCREIEESLGGEVINLCNQTTISQLGSLIKDADGYIGIDTFASHIAAGCGVNGVVFFGPTCESTWGPHQLTKTLKVITNPDWSCRPCHLDGCGGGKKSECLNFRLQEDGVIDRVVSYLGRSLEQ